jgi:hypothetical protein
MMSRYHDVCAALVVSCSARLQVLRGSTRRSASRVPNFLQTAERGANTGHGRNPRRYDAIWANPHFRVGNVEYLYEQGVAAGTDHALVVADLSLT